MKITHPLGLAIARELQEIALSASTVTDLYNQVEKINPEPFALDARFVRPQQSKAKNPVMLIGKTPAATEIETSNPMVGPAGQMLRNAAYDAGLDITQCHLTHASPWRARKDNTPSPTQIAMSRPLLLREIELVEPVCIIVLGAKATDGLFGAHPTMSDELHHKLTWNTIPVHIIRSHGFVLRHRQFYDSYVRTLRTIVGTITNAPAIGQLLQAA